MDEHLYIVTYDISAPRRWRRVFRLMKGYGEWLQLSVFQCRMNRKRRIELFAELTELIDQNEDHVVVLDLGIADTVKLRITSIGKEFTPIDRNPIVV